MKTPSTSFLAIACALLALGTLGGCSDEESPPGVPVSGSGGTGAAGTGGAGGSSVGGTGGTAGTPSGGSGGATGGGAGAAGVAGTAGSTTTWTPMTVRDFNDGAVGTQAQGADAFDGEAGQSFYTTDEVYEGGQAAECNITEGTTAFGTWGGGIRFNPHLTIGEEIWFQMAYHFPAGFNFWTDSGYLKTIRFAHIKPIDAANVGYLDVLVKTNGAGDADGWTISSEAHPGAGRQLIVNNDPPIRGQWGVLEAYAKLDTVSVDDGGTAIIRAWHNGVLIGELTSARTMANDTDVADFAYIFTYWNGNAPATQKAYVDNIIITRERPDKQDAAGNWMIGI